MTEETKYIGSDTLLDESLSETERAVLESDAEGFIKFCLESAKKAEESLPEKAYLESEVERILPDIDADDFVWFKLKQGNRQFKIGLSDILMCLRFAEEQGEVPELPQTWWAWVSGVYSKLNFFQDNKLKKGAGDW